MLLFYSICNPTWLIRLGIVWKREENQAEQEANRIEHKIKVLQENIRNHVEAVADPSNASIKEEIRKAIEDKKNETSNLEDMLEKLQSCAKEDEERFLRFAFNFIKNMGSRFLDASVVSRENRLRCKQIVFPAGFFVGKNNKVYTRK